MAAVSNQHAEAVLRQSFPGLDLSWPGLRVLHLDPPVLIADDFFTADECDAYAALRHLAADDPQAVHTFFDEAPCKGRVALLAQRHDFFENIRLRPSGRSRVSWCRNDSRGVSEYIVASTVASCVEPGADGMRRRRGVLRYHWQRIFSSQHGHGF